MYKSGDAQHANQNISVRPVILGSLVFAVTFVIFYALWDILVGSSLSPDNGFTTTMKITALAATASVTQIFIGIALFQNSWFSKKYNDSKETNIAIGTITKLIFGSFGLLVAVTIVVVLISFIGASFPSIAESFKRQITAPNSGTQTAQQNSPVTQTTEDPNHASAGDLDAKVTEANYYKLVGNVVNNGSKAYSYVEVDLNFYDKAGTLVGNGLDNVHDLEAGKNWQFSVNFPSGSDHYKLVRVTGTK